MFGILNINKTTGVTSRDVVNHVQRLVRPTKVGHAGTLDPMATGVLIVSIGQATRLFDYVQRMPKKYVGTFLLGRQSDTEDTDGNVIELSNPPQPSHEQVEQTLTQFVGEILQRPPDYSALKVNGRRSYELARNGKKVDLEARKVTVYSAKVVNYEYPELTLAVTCGSGTYIRSLGRDLAEALGTSAVMSSLVRNAIGDFRIEDTCRVEQLSCESLEAFLLPPKLAVSNLPSVQLSAIEIDRVAHGMAITNRIGCVDGEVAASDSSGRLVAILTPGNREELRPLKNFPAS